MRRMPPCRRAGCAAVRPRRRTNRGGRCGTGNGSAATARPQHPGLWVASQPVVLCHPRVARTAPFWRVRPRLCHHEGACDRYFAGHGRAGALPPRGCRCALRRARRGAPAAGRCCRCRRRERRHQHLAAAVHQGAGRQGRQRRRRRWGGYWRRQHRQRPRYRGQWRRRRRRRCGERDGPLRERGRRRRRRRRRRVGDDQRDRHWAREGG